MDSMHKLYIQRAQNELNLSIMILKISDNKQIQVSIFNTKENTG